MQKMSAIYFGILLGSFGLLTGCAGAADSQESQDSVASTESALLTDHTNFIYDGGSYSPPTQCTVGGTTMHCCPPGRAMIGAHVDSNTFKCAALSNTTGVRSLSTATTQRNGMHSCPLNQVMVGLHADLNRFVCQTVPGHSFSEYVDSGTQDGVMHVCNPNLNYTMTGIRIDQNKFNCATDGN